MNRRAVIDCLLATTLILPFAAEIGAADEKKADTAGVEEALKKLASAVKTEKYAEVAACITPPADKVWMNMAAAESARVQYEAALDKEFGKSEDQSPLRFFGGSLAERYYEAQGTIREVKAAGNGRVHVTVWTTRPELGKPSESAIFERKLTAVKIDGLWKFQLHSPMSGSPAVKRVKRTAPDGKAVEVYAEHYPKGGADEKNWEELKPISYDGEEEELKENAAVLARFAEALRSQTDRVRNDAYKTRNEALEGLKKAMPRLR